MVEALTRIGLPVPNSNVHTLMYKAVESEAKKAIIEPILKARRAAGLISKYNEEKLGQSMYKGRLYGTFNQMGAGTARYSSKEPNLQQIPAKMRDIIGGEDGLVIAPDYSQIEVRIKAMIARDTALIEALNSEDFHTYMATAMFPGRFIDEYLRRTGKGGTFTLNFYGGKPGIQKAAIEEGEVITDAQANGMIRGYRKRFPISHQFHLQVADMCRDGRPKRIDLPWGHYRTYEQPTPQQLINNIVQGYAAIGYKEGLLDCDERGLTPYIGCLLHDETVATGVEPHLAEEIGREMEEAMLAGMNRIILEYSDGFEVPVKVEVKAGTHWSK